MKNSTLKNILKLSIGLASLIPLTKTDKTLALDACAPSDSVTSMATESNPCFITPEMLKVKFYEIGFCTSDPLSSGSFDDSTCYKSWDNTSGYTTDIGKKIFEKMPGNIYRIPNGTYEYSYAIMNNSWVYKGKYKLKNGNTWYTRNDGGVTSDISSYAEWDDNISNMLGEENTGFCYDYSATTSDGNVTAVLTDSNNITATNAATCQSATRVIGSIDMNRPITMSEIVGGYRLKWKISNIGLGINHFFNGSKQVPSSFRGGPFTPQFLLLYSGIKLDNPTSGSTMQVITEE